MTAYREIVRDEQDTQRIAQMIRELGGEVEVIILPLELQPTKKDTSKNQQTIGKIAGCLKKYAIPGMTFEKEREMAWDLAMREKYGSH